ncbi:MAG: hypothetical protein KAI55_01855 [Candidatus Aenigmarchaeota archaeon]|nr:hypothetical protein [Candidatus Aenigmarchaeota archaeon]
MVVSGIDIVGDENLEAKIFSSIINDNWRTTLTLLAKDMNPWNVDLKLLFERLSYHIKEAELENLVIPSKIILLAAIIYKKKTENLYFKESMLEDTAPEEEPTVEEWYEDEVIEEPIKEEKFIPSIILPHIRNVRRKISLNELIESFEDVFKIKTKRMKPFGFSFPVQNIKEKIEETFILIKSNIKSEKKKETFFSRIHCKNKEERLSIFISMLYLINQKKIYCIQENVESDIKIKMVA